MVSVHFRPYFSRKCATYVIAQAAWEQFVKSAETAFKKVTLRHGQLIISPNRLTPFPLTRANTTKSNRHKIILINQNHLLCTSDPSAGRSASWSWHNPLWYEPFGFKTSGARSPTAHFVLQWSRDNLHGCSSCLCWILLPETERLLPRPRRNHLHLWITAFPAILPPYDEW